MLLPTLLAEDAPHFLRSVGVLPVAVLLPARAALALRPGSEAGGAVDSAAWAGLSLVWIGPLAMALPLAFALGSTTYAYFGRYARDPMTGYWFERGSVVLAGQIKDSWRGLGRRPYASRHAGRPARLSRTRPVDGLASGALPGRGARSRHHRIGRWSGKRPRGRLGVALRRVAARLEAAACPGPGHCRAGTALAGRPRPRAIRDLPGLSGRAAHDDQEHSTFAKGIELLGVAVMPDGRGNLQVLLRWRATVPLDEDYTVFVHYLRDGERIGQADAPPAGGYYPTSRWQAGDVINDRHVVPALLHYSWATIRCGSGCGSRRRGRSSTAWTRPWHRRNVDRVPTDGARRGPDAR